MSNNHFHEPSLLSQISNSGVPDVYWAYIWLWFMKQDTKTLTRVTDYILISAKLLGHPVFTSRFELFPDAERRNRCAVRCECSSRARTFTPLPGGGGGVRAHHAVLSSSLSRATFSPRPQLGEPCGNPEFFFSLIERSLMKRSNSWDQLIQGTSWPRSWGVSWCR